jgi:hypothetical protein
MAIARTQERGAPLTLLVVNRTQEVNAKTGKT